MISLTDLELRYREIFGIRAFELILARESNQRTFATPVHLGVGQEAIPVGISLNLNPGDLVFGNHRSHAHYLAMGGSPFSLFSEILGRASGCSGGKGGSMHISSMKNGFMGSMPIVAGTIPIAAGAALALKNSVIPSNQIAVVYFGDGAAEEGVFHETLNLASIYELPILFVCENNLMSSHLHISERQPSDDVRRFAVANNIQSVSVNGNDVFEMEATSSKLISYIRNTGKPAFLEAKTYRQYGHVGGYQDEIIGKNRQTDLQEWLQKDPLLWLKKLATEFQLDAVFEDIENSIELQMSSHWERALSEAWPESSSLTRNVYFED